MSNTYKDSLFRSLFSNEREFLSLYNALSGSNYPLDTPVIINTLADTLFTSRKNDVSGIIDGRLIAITEHQSTINENMPFRFLSHIARLLENTITDKAAIYQKKLIKMPCPEFYVALKSPIAYAGPDILRLSDAFTPAKDPRETGLELLVKIVNINDGRNAGVLQKCASLKDFSEYIDTVIRIQARIVDENLGINRDTARRMAIAEAISYCKSRGILSGFFEKLLPEEVNMLTTEWKLEEALVVEREEGRMEGRMEEKLETAKNLKSLGIDLEQIARATGLSYNDLARL